MAVAQLNVHHGFIFNDLDDALPAQGDLAGSRKSNVLSNKLTSVLSSSYADSEIRDALRLLDARGAKNAEETRLNLRTDAQQEVIDANARIIDDFGKVAKQLQRVGALITILNQTCDEMRTHIQAAKRETAPMLEEASTLLSRRDETEAKQSLLDAFNTHFLLSDDDLTTLTSSAEPVNDRYFSILNRTKQIHKDCEILLGHENQRLGVELLDQTSRNLDAAYKKLYTWIQREFKGLDLEDPRTSGSIRRSLKALSERPTLFQNCLEFFAEAREVTLSEAFQKALTDSTIGAAKAIEFSTHDPLRYIGDMLAWVHSTTVSEKEALEGLFVSDADEISRGLNVGKSTEPWSRLQRTSSASDEEYDENNAGEDDIPSFDGQAALSSLISRNMASVSQTLHQRVSLTIRGLADQLSIYKAYNVLLFYEDIFIKLLGSKRLSAPQNPHEHPQYRAEPDDVNTLLDTLLELQSQALSAFTASVTEEVDSVQPVAEPNLTPPAILAVNLSLLTSILHLRSVNLTRDEFANLYRVLLKPVLSLCSEIAETLAIAPDKSSTKSTGNDKPDSTTSGHDSDSDSDSTSSTLHSSLESLIYTLNYLYPVLNTLTTLHKDSALAEQISPPLRQAQLQIPTVEEKLTHLLTDSFLHISSLDFLLSFLTNETNRSVSVTEKRKWLREHLEECSASLDTFLAGAIMDAQEDLAKLSDKEAGKRVAAEAVEAFCIEFERAAEELDALDAEWEKVKGESATDGNDEVDSDNDGNDRNGNDNEDDDKVFLRELYPRTVDEVRALLG